MVSEKVGIVGVGYVGVHLVEVFSSKFDVVGFDVSEARVNFLKESMSSFDRILFTTNAEELSSCDLICISVPTLLNMDNSINDQHLKSAVSTVQEFAKPGCTIVMESSVHVGMTRKLLGHLLDKNLNVGFSPERVDPGRIDPPCHKIPKIVSGINEQSLDRIKYFYGSVFKTIVPVSTMETAEMCKLYENCFRMINIAYANEGADACLRLKIDPHEMIAACSTKPFGFTPFYPGLGVGGHCIPVNPYYLAVNCDFPLLRFATHTTVDRPAKKASEIVSLNPCANTYLVVGLAFKKGESLTTNSPGLAFATALKNNHDKRVYGLDPVVQKGEIDCITFDEAMKKIKSKDIDIVCVAMKQTLIDYELLQNECDNHGIVFFSYV